MSKSCFEMANAEKYFYENEGRRSALNIKAQKTEEKKHDALKKIYR